MEDQVQFVAFASFVDSSFWFKLSELKLNQFRLDEAKRDIWGYYSNVSRESSLQLTDSPKLCVDFESFDEKGLPTRSFISHGSLMLVNTIERFRSLGKQELLSEQGQQIWADISSGRCIRDCSLLSRFLLLCYADLKKFKYYFWFAFPVLNFPGTVTLLERKSAESAFSAHEVCNLQDACTSFVQSDATGYFLAIRSPDVGTFRVEPLSKFWNVDLHNANVFIGFCDPCSSETWPGWGLRNLLFLIGFHKKCTSVNVICWRKVTKDGQFSSASSLVLKLELKATSSDFEDSSRLSVVGWEKNEHSKLVPKVVDLSSSLDPERLAQNTVDLNLKLMKWRLVPELNLSTLSHLKCLLLGSGTLGCCVARCLLAWGITNITFVDNGRVSYSNPVRQNLFTFQSCLDGGLPKAETAAKAIRDIFPLAHAKGVALSIPMPGHIVTGDRATAEFMDSVRQLEQLVRGHDVVFLLTDTRESRWMPTLLAAAYGKTALSVALGFDSFVVVRHGANVTTGNGDSSFSDQCSLAELIPGQNEPIPGHKLGCYFCCDIVAPGDSTKDRSLDQECTVTRPGISYLASANAVELLVSLFQHPLKSAAPAFISENSAAAEKESVLGLVPHQIRGFLSRFTQICPSVQRFSQCTACSAAVLHAFSSGGHAFLLDAVNEPAKLEQLTGLDKLQEETLAMDLQVLELSDTESVKSLLKEDS